MYKIEDMWDGSPNTVHTSGLRLHNDKTLDRTEVLAHVAHKDLGYVLPKLVGVGYNEEGKGNEV